jgi:hypothetical protein
MASWPARRRSTKQFTHAGWPWIGYDHLAAFECGNGFGTEARLVGGGGYGGGEHDISGHRAGGIDVDPVVADADPDADLDPGRTTEPATLAPERVEQLDPDLVAVPRDSSGRAGDIGHHDVGIGVGQRACGGILLFEEQTIAGATGGAMQLDAGRQQRLVGLDELGLLEGSGSAVGEERPFEGLDVAEAATATLEVGFEHEGDLADAAMACSNGFVETWQPGPGLRAPRLAGLGGEASGEACVARDQSGAEQRRGRLEVVGGELERLAHGPHRMAEFRSFVPEWVPERAGDRLDVIGALVEQEEVEVAVGAQFGTAVTPDRNECDVVAMADGVGVQRREPGIDRIAQGTGEGATYETAVCDDVGSGRTQRHGRPLRFCSAGFTDTASLYGRRDSPTEAGVQIGVRRAPRRCR